MNASNVLFAFGMAALLFLGLFVSSIANQAIDAAKPQTAAQEAALFSARQ